MIKLPWFYERNSWRILCVALLVAPVVLFGAARALESNSNKVLDWLPADFEETKRLFWFVKRFGSDEILVASWPGCTLDDERLAQFADELSKPYPLDSGASAPLFREVETGATVLARLQSEPLNLSAQDARGRLDGWLLGKDQSTTCVVARIARIEGSKDNGYDRHRAVAYVRDVAAKIGIADDDLYLAGPTVDSVAIDVAGQQGVIGMGLFSIIWGSLLARLCLPKWRWVIAVFLCSISAAAISLAVVYYSGNRMDATLMTMPALIFVLTTSGGIHFTHYLRDTAVEASRSGQPTRSTYSVWRAIEVGGLPCFLSCITTAIGLSSLAISAVVPVVRFGVFSSVGVLVCLGCLLLIWPAVAQVIVSRWPPRQAEAGPSDEKQRSKPPWWSKLFGFAYQQSTPILIASLIVGPLLIIGLTGLNTSVHLRDLLPGSSDLIRSYDRLEELIGAAVPVEVVLQFPIDENPSRRSMFERARLVEQIRSRVAQMDESGAATAATTFAPSLSGAKGGRQLLLRNVVGSHLLRNRESLHEIGMVAQDEQHDLWRVSTRVPSSVGDYSTFLAKLDREVDDVLSAHNAGATDQVSAITCGAIPLIQMAQRQLLADLINSFVVAFVLIAITMIVLLRSTMGGLLAMIPNVFPVVLVFGIMGWRDSSIDIGTMMTASIALGIAVDDTLHFIISFRRAFAKSGDRRDAIRVAYRQVSTAMIQTSIVCGLGMIAFMTSAFGPISRFAGMMISLLSAAVVGDLILLPAMLASPLGRFFVPRPAVEPTATVGAETVAHS